MKFINIKIERFLFILLLCYLSFVVGCYGFGIIKGFWFILSYDSFPQTIYILFMVLFVGINILFDDTLCSTYMDLICSFILFLMHVFVSIKPLGDYLEIMAARNVIRLSEPFSDLTYSIVRDVLREGIRYIPPIFGFFASYIFFLVGSLIAKKLGYKIKFGLHRILYISIAINFFFFHNQLENSFLGLPFILLYLYFIINYITENCGQDLKYFILSAIFLVVACLFHGQYLFLSPSIIIFVLYKNNTKEKIKKIMIECIIFVTVAAIILILSHQVSILLEYDIIKGNIYGGGDNTRFVYPFNFINVGNIVLHSANFVVFIIPLYIYRVITKKDEPVIIFPNPVFFVLTILSLGFLSFITLWNFDLGFPRDLDLMFSSSFPLSLFLFFFLKCLINSNDKIVLGILILSIYLNSIMLSKLLISSSQFDLKLNSHSFKQHDGSLFDLKTDFHTFNRSEETFLSMAVYTSLPTLLETLLNRCGDDVNKKSKNGWTALIWAARLNRKEQAQILLNNGANINAIDNYGWTALMWASFNGHKDVAEVLLNENANINIIAENNETALELAEANHHPEIVKLLKKYGTGSGDSRVVW